MDAKERWQALQAQLTRAQAQLNAADRVGALESVNAALAIDPNSLAAHALRERAEGLAVAPPPPAVQPAYPPLVSSEGLAQFELRARRRRVDHRVDAARAALAIGRASDAASAIDEIRELDPDLPELRELATTLEAMATPQPRPTHAGRWLAAVAAFAAILFGGTWLQESGVLGSRSIVGIAPLVAQPEPLVATVSAAPFEQAAHDAPVATTGNLPDAPLTPDVSHPVPASEPSSPMPAPEPSRPAPAPVTSGAVVTPSPAASTNPTAFAAAPLSSVLPATPPPPPPAPAPMAPAPLVASLPASAPPSVPVPVPPDDAKLVQQALQRYRSAYEGLDARSARAVWPAVNEAALARAFGGLESQALVFDACDVSVRGDAANAVCRGTARYVPKVGSREPRIEPRTWNFTLRKSGGGAWTIESARAER